MLAALPFFAVLAAVARAGVFHTISETQQWAQYCSPFTANRCCNHFPAVSHVAPVSSLMFRTFSDHGSGYFEDRRPINTNKLYIGAGFGRTGTTSLHGIAQSAGIMSIHAGRIAGQLPFIAYMEGSEEHPHERFDTVYPEDGIARAVMDIPVGEFLWDLMDAFPDNRVVLTVRPVSGRQLAVVSTPAQSFDVVFQGDEWYESLHRLHLAQERMVGKAFRDMPQNNVAFGTGHTPSARQALRRYGQRTVSLGP
jgi:hypothetical protein